MTDFKSVDEVIEKAGLIVDDYAFICTDKSHVLAISLADIEHRCVFNCNLALVDSTFDEIEGVLVTKILQKDVKYLEE